MRFPSFFRSPRVRTDSGAVPVATPVAPQSNQSKRAARAILPAILGLGVLSLGVLGLRAQNSAPPVVAVSRHALNNNGRIEGSAQQLLGESINLNGGAFFGGDLLVPGNPKVKINGKPDWKGQRKGGGSNSPSNYQVSINSSVDLGFLVTQSDPIALDNVATPPNPTGTRSVNINSAGDVAAVGAWNTVRNLNVNGGAPNVAVPAGTYGNFQVNSGALVLGTPNDSSPDVYNFQNLTFNGQTQLKCVGPVVVNVRNGMNVNGILGSSQNQAWLQLGISNGGLNINNNAIIYGAVRAPNGSVNVNGTVWGSVQADRLSINNGGVIKLADIVEPTPVPTPMPTATPIPTATPTPAPTATPVPTAIPVPTPTGAPLATVSPIIECVENLGGGQYRARFGTNVPGMQAQIIPVGTTAGNENKFSPNPIDRDQPTSFLPGRTVNSFQVDFNGSTSLTWTLRGRSVTASANSNGCPVPTPTPTVAPTATPIPVPTATPIPIPTATPIPLPTATPIPLPTATPIPLPTATPAPTATPTPAPTATPIPNRAPVAADDNYAVDEEGALNVATPGVLRNDSDADGDNLQAQLVAGPAHGTIDLFPNGGFRYVPAPDYNGADGFTYRANDGALASQTATVSIAVNPVNDAPIADAQNLSLNEDDAISFALTGSDIDGDALTFDVVSAPRHGVISGTEPGLTYRPNRGFFGTDTLEFVVSDGTTVSPRATVTFSVAHVNHAPISVADAYATDEDTPFVIAPPGVLANDSSDPGDVLSAILVSAPAHGTLSLQSDGSFGYAPNPDYNGSDSFRYQPRDNANPALSGAPVTVTITVNPVNDAPVALDQDAGSVDFNKSLAGVLRATDIDSPAGSLRFALVSQTIHGNVTVALDGSFVYRTSPTHVYTGPDSFTFRVSDGDLDSNVATVSVNVTRPPAPVALDDEYATTDTPGTVLNGASVLANDSGEGPLRAELVAGTSHGLLNLKADGTFTYIANNGFDGNDSFTYRTRGAGGLSNLATATIRVTHINRAPVAVADSYATDEDTALDVAAAGVLLNDSDFEGDNLRAQLVTATQNGRVVLNADGSFVYTPNADFNGSDSFTYRVSDGTLQSASVAVSILVNAVNDAPTVVDSTHTIGQRNGLNIMLSGRDVDAGLFELKFAILTQPRLGTVFLDNNGIYSYDPNPGVLGTDSFTFQATDKYGAVSNIGTVTIIIERPFDAPRARADQYSVVQGQILNGSTVLVNDDNSGLANPALTAVLETNPAHGALTLNADGTFRYVPEAAYVGADSFTYHAQDSQGATSLTATVTITVTQANRVPVAVADAYTTDEDTPLVVNKSGVLTNDTDADGNALTAIAVGQPAHGTLNLDANGGFVYTPAADYNGADSFSYRASDGTAQSALATVSITVNAVNDAPVAADVDAGTVAAGGSKTGRLVATDVDDAVGALTYAVVDAPAHGTVTVNSPFGTLAGAGPDAFRYVTTPGDSYAGPDSFTYRVTDASGAVSNLARVSFTITAPPAPVVARNDEYSTTDAYDASVSGNVLSNDSGDGPLNAVLVSDVSQAKLTLNADGSFIYRGNSIFVGDESFSYRARDVNGNLSAPATVTIHVTHINRAPYAGSDYYNVGANGTLNVPAPGLLINDYDADVDRYGNRFGDKLTASLLTTESARYGTVTVRADGSFDYVLNPALPAQRLTDSFYYNLSDGQGGASIGRVTISIDLANNAPVAQSQSLVLGSGQYYLPITLSGSDPDGDQISYELLSLPTQGTLRLPSGGPLFIGRIYNPSGIFYQRNNPGAGDQPRDSFTFRVRDARGLTSPSATVSIRFGAINSAPVAVADEATTTGAAITIPVLANDTDADGDALRVVAVNGGRSGSSVTISADAQSVIYNPGPNFDPGSSDNFTYSVTDGLSQPGVIGRVTVRQVRAGSVDAYIYSYGVFKGYFGTNVVNGDGSGQIAGGNTVAPGSNYPGAAAYALVIRNTGPIPDSFVLRGPAREPGASITSAHWSVRYFYDGGSTGSEITEAVTSAAGWTSPETDNAGVTRRVRVEVRADGFVADGATLQTLFDIRSLRDPGARDVVGALSTKGAATPNG